MTVFQECVFETAPPPTPPTSQCVEHMFHRLIFQGRRSFLRVEISEVGQTAELQSSGGVTFNPAEPEDSAVIVPGRLQTLLSVCICEQKLTLRCIVGAEVISQPLEHLLASFTQTVRVTPRFHPLRCFAKSHFLGCQPGM